MAKTVQVGTCLLRVQAYPTISQAVSAVPSGSTILVCPGTYAEQVIITQPLTLRGVQSGNAANPTIAVPLGGLTKSVVLGNGVKMFFQIMAQNTDSGPVNISNLAVDGTGNNVGSDLALSAIYYRNASGNISHVATFNQTGSGGGFGIFMEPVTSSMKTVSITASNIHDFDSGGIRSNANSTLPTLTVSIKRNLVVTTNSLAQSVAEGIDIDGIGTISGNHVITHPELPGVSSGVGIAGLSNLTISSNTVEGFSIGIWPLGNSNTVTSNHVSLASGGIVISGANNIVEYNTLFDIIHGGEALGFNCTGTSNTVIHNTINGSFSGIIGDTGTNTISPNSYSNVANLISPPC
jgi:hypothetical protein